MADINTGSLIPDIIAQAWSKYKTEGSDNSQFRYLFSIIDEIESLLGIPKFSVLPLEVRDNIAKNFQDAQEKPLSLSNLENLFETCNNLSLVKSIENAIKDAQNEGDDTLKPKGAEENDSSTKPSQQNNDLYKQPSSQLTNTKFDNTKSLENPLDNQRELENDPNPTTSVNALPSTRVFLPNPTFAVPTTLPKTATSNNQPSLNDENRDETAKGNNTLDINDHSLFKKAPLNTSTPLPVDKVRDFKNIRRSKWDNRRTVSSINLAPRVAIVDAGDEEEEANQLIDSDAEKERKKDDDIFGKYPTNKTDDPPLNSHYYSNENEAGERVISSGSYDSSGSRRSSRKLGLKRSANDVRELERINEYVSHLEEMVYDAQSKLSDAEKRISKAEQERHKLEDDQDRMRSQIDVLEHDLDISQRSMAKTRMMQNRVSESFMFPRGGFLGNDEYSGDKNRRKTTDGLIYDDEMNGINNAWNTYNSNSETMTQKNNPYAPYGGGYDDQENIAIRPSSAPSTTADDKGFGIEKAIQRPQSEQSTSSPNQRNNQNGDERERRRAHRPSSSSVMSISPDETAGDFDQKIEELEVEDYLKVYLKELFRGGQQQLINIIYQQQNDLSSLTRQIGEYEGSVDQIIELKNQYEERVQSMDEFDQQREAQIRADALEEAQKQVREQLLKYKDLHETERQNERTALEAQMKKELKDQLRQQASEYMNQLQQLETQLHQREQELENLKHFKYRESSQSRSRRVMRSLEDELNETGFKDNQHGALNGLTTLSLPTDEEGNLDSGTFLQKILVPMAEEQSVYLKSVSELPVRQDPAIKREIQELAKLDETKDKVDIEEVLKKVNEYTTQQESQLTPRKVSAKSATIPQLDRFSKLDDKLRKGMSVAEIAQLEYEQRRIKKRTANRSAETDEDLSAGNLTYMVSKVLNNPYLLLFTIIIAIILSFVFSPSGTEFIVRWIWQKFGGTTPQTISSSGRLLAAGAAETCEHNNQVWWQRLLPKRIEKIFAFVDQLARPRNNNPPV